MKKILFTMAVLSLASLSFSQDFGFGDDFGGSDYSSDFGSDSFDSAEPTVSISGEVGAKARAWGGTKNEDAEFDTRNYDSAYDFSKSKTEPSAHANLDFAYSGDFTDAVIKLKFNQNTIKDYPEDIIDEAYASGSFKDGRFQLKAGKIKEVWGKGDKVHVLDNFNANDYSDFIFPDYIDRRIGEIMFKTTANLSWDYNIKLEGIYAPMMTADRFASEKSMLYPYAQSKLTETVKGILKAQGSALANSAVDFDGKTVDGDNLIGAIMDLSEFSTDNLYEDDIRTIKYSQAGARLTGTLGGIDWGASYYYGHYKQPSANVEKYAIYSNADDIKAGAWKKYYATALSQIKAGLTAAGMGTKIATMTDEQIYAAAQAGTFGDAAKAAALSETTVKGLVDTELTNNDYTLKNALPSLNYDQVQVFGLEAAFVLWKFNTRWEGAYNLTEDIAGDNPWIKNNSVSWLAGFDIDLPIHNLNLNVQETGTYILNNDKIEDNTVTVGYLAGKPIEVPIGTADVDYNSDGKYTKNKLIVLLSDKWLNEKLTTEVQGIYCFEDKGYMVAPKVEYNVSEGLTFGLRGVYLYCDNEEGEFYNFTQNAKNHDKAFVELTAKYQF
ncbi:MAG: hypothetical protein J6I53_12195 [Treponema sp.]|nr:hypothetical protein [Treponema sp.]